MSILNPSVSPRERKPLGFLRKAKMPASARVAVPVESEHSTALTPEASFLQALSLERKRAERSGKHFLLMLLEGEEIFGQQGGPKTLSAVTAVLRASIRETDLSGWYRQSSTVGVIFTEVNAAEAPATQEVLNARMHTALRSQLEPGDVDQIQVSFHWFPEATDGDGWQSSEASVLYPDVRERGGSRKLALLIKRLIDIGGGAAALLVFSPVVALIAVAVKLTSKGPILYRQVRIGQYGRRFTFLKFRSMYVNSSATIHQEYVQSLIRGGNGPQPAAAVPGQVYKIKHDPRVTPLGRFLRKTSLDELPQFLNVLKGEMSLVGPRPPIPYEMAAYDTWHRRRLLEAKPGVTGLWQVSGRSRTTFDEMVRLDLRYAKAWSLWLDLRILAQTPRAVLSGEGAY
ncbi:MAG TPA: sugar transferase [Terriglobales bacterium]